MTRIGKFLFPDLHRIEREERTREVMLFTAVVVLGFATVVLLMLRYGI
jgi:hypothetical protein